MAPPKRLCWKPTGSVQSTFHFCSLLYIMIVLFLSVESRIAKSDIWKATIAAVLPVLLSILLLESALRLCADGKSYFNKDWLQLVDVLTLSFSLVVLAAYSFSGENAPNPAQYAAALVRFVRFVRQMYVNDRLEMSANSKARSTRYISARAIVHTSAMLMIASGTIVLLEGVITYHELQESVLLVYVLGPATIRGMVAGGSGLLLVGAGAALAAHLSVSKETTL